MKNSLGKPLDIELVREPGWVFPQVPKNAGFLVKSTFFVFLAIIVQKLKFPNNSINFP
jgi:hypothetical protein